MKTFFLMCALMMPAVSWAESAPTFACQTGGQAAADNYNRVLRLLQPGERLTAAQEQDVLQSLEEAVAHRCGYAAHTLADIKLIQLAYPAKDTPPAVMERLDEEIHSLLQQAAETDGTGSLLGAYYLNADSKFFSPAKAMPLLEQAAGDGDEDAAELLFNLFDQRTAVAGDAAPIRYREASTAAGAIDFRVTVEVLARDGCPFARITHRNVGMAAMYFEPLEPMLRIRDATGRALQTTGIIADGPPFLPEDYVKLLPGKDLTREVTLNRSHALKRSGTYKLEVNGGYYDPRLLKEYPHGGMIVRSFKYDGRCKKPSPE